MAWSPVVKLIFNCVALTYVAVWATALYVTVELERKFVPLIVKVCAAAPGAAEVGERLVMVGAGLSTVKFTEFDAPPPGAGLVTTTAKLPAVTRSELPSVIFNWVGLTKVGACATPWKVTIEVEMKFVPVMVRVWGVVPVVTEAGDRLVMVGAGLFTVRLIEFDAPPPGARLVTTTE